MVELMLSEAWQALTGRSELPARAEVRGGEGLLGSALPVFDLCAAAVEAALLAASTLTSVRDGRPAEPAEAVSLDGEHLACAVRSERYLRVDGRSLGSAFDPLSRFLPTAGGWIRLHANYPWHRDRLLSVLGVPADQAPEAVATWDAEALEEAVVAAGGCAAAVRSPESWAGHPQGRAVGAAPLLAVEALDGPGKDQGRPLPPMPGRAAPPAAGIRVLDFTRVIAGPVCTRMLAALGAEVLRVDTPALPELPLHVYDGLPGKASTLLDLRDHGDREVLEGLLSTADVVVQGYRPGCLDPFGLAAESLGARFPGLAVVELNAWGHMGPWAAWRGFDSLVQAASGIARIAGVAASSEESVEPGTLPAQALDHATGYLAAAATLTALASRSAGSGTQRCTLSLAQTAAWLLRQPRRPTVPGVAPRAVDPSPYLVDLAGPDGVVTTVGPPGRVGDFAPRWPRTISGYGADPPRWPGT